MKRFNCILLVDDDGTTNFLNKGTLERMQLGDEIHIELNGEKALNYVQHYSEKHNNTCPELILLDLKMPVLDGFEFLEYLRIKKFINKEQVKTIVLTTSTHKEDLKRLDKFGVKYISKPLTPDKLTPLL